MPSWKDKVSCRELTLGKELVQIADVGRLALDVLYVFLPLHHKRNQGSLGRIPEGF